MTFTLTEESRVDLTDQEAIRRSQNGDAAAFEHLYRTHCKRVYNLCLRILKNAPEAEDLTQQAFLQVFRKIGTFRGDAVFTTWLHRVTVNAVLMHLRRKKRTESAMAIAEPDAGSLDGVVESGGSDTTMLGAVERLNLMRAIRQLPAGCKRLFVMHDVMGYRHDEIAKLVGCSIGCSKSQVHRARRKLRQLLGGDVRQAEPAVSV